MKFGVKFGFFEDKSLHLFRPPDGLTGGGGADRGAEAAGAEDMKTRRSRQDSREKERGKRPQEPPSTL